MVNTKKAAHAKLSASGAHRWLACPGSISAIENSPEAQDTSSPYAQEGTAAHALAEISLRTKSPASSFVGSTFSNHTVTAEMAEHVQTYVDYVKEIKGSLLVEQRVSYDKWVPDGFGTADAIVMTGDTLHCIDLKFGKGVQVYAKSNEQGMLYALGAYSEYGGVCDFKKVTIHIHQPRLSHFDTWTLSVQELLTWANALVDKAHLALSPSAPLNPGDKQCRFCPVKSTCGALAQHTQQVILAEFDSCELPQPEGLTEQQRINIIKNKDLIVSFINSVEKSMYKELMEGEENKHFKLVEGRANRKWTEDAEDKLNELLGEDAYDKKLLTLTKAEKLLGRKVVNTLTVKPKGKPTMVPIGDKRPPFYLNVFE